MSHEKYCTCNITHRITNYVFRWGYDNQHSVENTKVILAQKRNEIIQSASQLLGVKYRSVGKSPKKGFDCSGFTSYILSENGINIPSHSSAQLKKGVAKTRETAQAGDLVFFKRTTATSPFHVAMIYQNINGQIKIIHSTSSKGVVIDDLNKSKYWDAKVWMIKDVIEENTYNNP